jgi:hypothetical protein
MIALLRWVEEGILVCGSHLLLSLCGVERQEVEISEAGGCGCRADRNVGPVRLLKNYVLYRAEEVAAAIEDCGGGQSRNQKNVGSCGFEGLTG